MIDENKDYKNVLETVLSDLVKFGPWHHDKRKTTQELIITHIETCY